MAIEKNKTLSSNMEDYLETIALLKKNQSVARVKDISRLLGVKKPSVTGALNILAKDGLVVHERYGYVDLTLEGQKIARGVQRRHDIFTKFLVEILGINSKIAAEDACKMEHSISPHSFEKLTKFIEFVEESPDNTKPEWLKGLDYYLKTGRRRSCKLRQIKGKNKS